MPVSPVKSDHTGEVGEGRKGKGKREHEMASGITSLCQPNLSVSEQAEMDGPVILRHR